MRFIRSTVACKSDLVMVFMVYCMGVGLLLQLSAMDQLGVLSVLSATPSVAVRVSKPSIVPCSCHVVPSLLDVARFHLESARPVGDRVAGKV